MSKGELDRAPENRKIDILDTESFLNGHLGKRSEGYGICNKNEYVRYKPLEIEVTIMK